MIRALCQLPMLALVLTLALALTNSASAADRLTWEDLAPPFDDQNNPFKTLNDDQRKDLYRLVWIREAERNGSRNQSLATRTVAVRESLEASGMNPDALLRQVDEFDREKAIWQETLIEELDGREVRIAGYLLPLESSDTAIMEFLLVPYVGACIHFPMPPSNQIVHVRTGGEFESEGLYKRVWVTGHMSTRPQSLSLYLVDGRADVRVGYSLEVAEIEPYQ